MNTVESVSDKGLKDVYLIALKNKNNMEVKLLSLGASIAELLVPDKQGNIENVVLTYDKFGEYQKNPTYFGVTVGRTSGRIGQGSFIIDGKVYDIKRNSGENSIHGGIKGFSFQLWDYRILEEEGRSAVEFTYRSKDMEEGYPGNLDASVIYSLTDDNELHIEYKAITDKKTLCNLTNHSYFNLSGNYKRKITEQYLEVKSDKFLELDENQAPTGRLIDVTDTPMDFRKSKLIGRDIESNYDQLTLTKGFDQPWLLSADERQIVMHDEISGRKMTVSTTYPCVVVYSYNHANNERLKYDKTGSKYDAICFETQYEPDGINHKGFNPAILNAYDKYHEKTVFKFGIIADL